MMYPPMGRAFSSIPNKMSNNILLFTNNDPVNLVAQGLYDTGHALRELHRNGLVHGFVQAKYIFFEANAHGNTKLYLPFIIKDGEERDRTDFDLFPHYEFNCQIHTAS